MKEKSKKTQKRTKTEKTPREDRIYIESVGAK